MNMLFRRPPFERFSLKCEMIPGLSYLQHNWILIGPQGAIHVHVTGAGQIGDTHLRPGGGIECHWGQPHPSLNRSPDHQHCEILQGPCWHDGSSMFVSDHILPMLDLDSLHVSHHRFVFDHCKDWYEDKIDRLYGTHTISEDQVA